MLNKLKYILNLKHAKYALPFVWVVAIASSLVEAYFYQGFVFKHTSIDSAVIYALFVLVGGLNLFLANEGNNFLIFLSKKIYVFSTLLFSFVFYFFFLVEKINYPNFVFSHYHIQPYLLSTSLAISILAIIFSSREDFKKVYKNPKRIFNWFPVVMILIWITIPNITDIILTSYKNVGFILNNPRASYDDKMREKLGKTFYNYVLFVKNNTPEDSTLLLPPFPAYPWPQSGNIPYMTYFLHPRKLLNGEEYSPKYDLIKDEVDYVLIVWGETGAVSDGYTHGWPKFDIKAEYMLLLDNDGSTNTIKSDYVFNKYIDKESWGIIKVKK